MNSVTLIGNLGADPEMIQLQNGTAVTNFRVAVNETYNSGNEKTEKTHWFSVKAFGKIAEVVTQYLHKGAKVGIHGRLSYEEWEKDGQKRSAVKIIADRIDFLSWKTVEEEEKSL